jgi:hypothetical protein
MDVMATLIVYITFAVLSLSLGYIVYRLLELKNREPYKDELDRRFQETWSGRDGEELYAWYLVKLDLIQFGAKEREFKYVENKINEIDKNSMLSHFMVDETGEIESSVSSGNMSFSE